LRLNRHEQQARPRSPLRGNTGGGGAHQLESHPVRSSNNSSEQGQPYALGGVDDRRYTVGSPGIGRHSASSSQADSFAKAAADAKTVRASVCRLTRVTLLRVHPA
jgi:hypothetical protein